MDNDVSLNEKFAELQARNEEKLSNAKSLIDSYNIVSDMVSRQLESIKLELIKLNTGGGVSGKIKNAITIIQNTISSPIIKDKENIILEQIIVLNVGILESYINDIFRIVGNLASEKFFFADGENIIFNSNMLKDKVSFGDIILQSIKSGKGKERGQNFQDIQSIRESVKRYLHIEFEKNYPFDNLILTTAFRHIIIHNSSIVDAGFINQIRNTKYKDKYKIGDNISIDRQFIDDSQKSIRLLAEYIISELLN